VDGISGVGERVEFSEEKGKKSDGALSGLGITVAMIWWPEPANVSALTDFPLKGQPDESPARRDL
jgi:hypothetical protein